MWSFSYVGKRWWHVRNPHSFGTLLVSFLMSLWSSKSCGRCQYSINGNEAGELHRGWLCYWFSCLSTYTVWNNAVLWVAFCYRIIDNIKDELVMRDELTSLKELISMGTGLDNLMWVQCHWPGLSHSNVRVAATPEHTILVFSWGKQGTFSSCRKLKFKECKIGLACIAWRPGHLIQDCTAKITGPAIKVGTLSDLVTNNPHLRLSIDIMLCLIDWTVFHERPHRFRVRW